MNRILRFTVLSLVLGLVGCAGGWRNGAPPAGYASYVGSESAVAMVAAPAAATPAPAAKPAKANGKATEVGAGEATFRFDGAATSVNVAGEFNAWSTSADPMAKRADGVWELKKPLAAGRYQYKFVVNGSDWKADAAAPETSDDGFGGKNSVVVIGAGAAAAPAAAAAAKPAGKGPTVTGDGVVFRYAGAGNTVNLAGEFNAWSTSADALVKGADGTWTITKKLADGRYQYKFVIDGGTWKEDPNAAESVDDGYGGKNSVIAVGAAGAAPAAAAAAPAMAKPAAAAPSGAGPAVTGDGVVFRYSGAANTVNLAGEFNAWSTSADALVKGADGTWTITKKLANGRYAYKFVIDGGTWKEDPNAKETVDDGYGGKNSVIEVGGSAAAPAATPAPAAPAAAAAPATGDGVVFRYSGAGNTVNLAGEFNAWSTSADALTKGADGTWTITKPLAPGRYAYKFVIDGGTWKEDPNAKESVDDGYGGKNSVVVVGGAADASAGAAAAPAAPAKVTGKAKPPVVAASGVTFTYAGAGNTVALAGDFNDWSLSTDPMKRQADGTWTITKKLPAGTHGYKFVVDGTTWKTDEANPASADDGFGGKNSVVVVK